MKEFFRGKNNILFTFTVTCQLICNAVYRVLQKFTYSMWSHQITEKLDKIAVESNSSKFKHIIYFSVNYLKEH